MLRRRLALPLTVVALATLASGAAPAAAAPTSNTICVGLVVDFDALGGGTQSTCARIAKGKTGYDVLTAGGHTFAICSNGVLGSIDGKPADGCTQKNDEQHFWSYWHRAPGSHRWTYSTEGGGTYEPAANSTEGWRWTKSPPPDVAFASICKPSPTPTPKPTTAPRGASALPSTPAPAPTVTSTRPHGVSHGPPVRHPSSAAPAASAAATTQPDAIGPNDPSRRARSSSDGPSGGLIAGIVIVVGLGGAAAWLARRRRTDSS